MKKALLFCAIISAAHATAASILIDFGPTATPGSSPTWNNFTSTTDASSLALSDSTGAPTNYTITLSDGDINSLSDNTTPPLTTYNPFTPATVQQDSIFQSSARTFTLSGLDPSVAYSLTFYSYVDRNTSRSTDFSIPGYAPLTLEPSGDPIASDSGGMVGTILSVTPDSSGNIAITVDNNAANWILNGMEITYTIPEPSAALLSIFGLLPLLRRRR